MKGALGILLSWLLLAPTAAVGEDLSRLYDRAKLAQEKPRLARRIQEMYTKALWPQFTAEEKRILAGVAFEFPLVGEISGDPMEYYSGERGGRQFVAMPVLSLMFLEDLATAYAWLHVHGYSLETIDEYVTMLRYKQGADFRGGRHPPPLEGLQIPPKALADRRVDELSLRFRNTAFAFILLHELGHIRYGHRGYAGISTAQARANEQGADEFALDLLERTSTIPMGAILFFQAQAYFMPSRGQLQAEGRIKTDKDWDDYLRSKVTHPLTADRLRAMAARLDRTARRSGPGPEGETLRFIATRLEHISAILEEPELQGCMAVVAHRADPSTLAPRRPRELTATLLERWCGGKK
jgi:hypothetical protein